MGKMKVVEAGAFEGIGIRSFARGIPSLGQRKFWYGFKRGTVSIMTVRSRDGDAEL